ncbi:uncharacterized protein LOC126789487 [Argentina anserina]|uniref:uncharacterized protein LOC126789487 n=1 Tax=Argentina anserina TaxID=57926 RepID=UPI0021763281|nr:uncharacterized protein LOC126789487 [Potentilla anserina]
MAAWNGMMSKSSGFGVGGSSEVFEEEKEVWGVVQERSYSNSAQKSYSSGSSSAWRPSTAPRSIPRANNNTPSTHEAKVVQKSAPLNIHDWSKIYGKSSSDVKINGSWVTNEDDHDGIDGNVHFNGEEEDDDDMVPPHEWMARKLARSQISSFSVCEGIGRTLKGRDLNNVRNTILTKTGFLE